MKFPKQPPEQPQPIVSTGALSPRGGAKKRQARSDKSAKAAMSPELNALPRGKAAKAAMAAKASEQEGAGAAAPYPHDDNADAEEGDTVQPTALHRRHGKEEHDGNNESDGSQDKAATPASTQRASKRRKKPAVDGDASLLGAKALINKPNGRRASPAKSSESAAQLTELLLLASRYGDKLKDEGLSPLQIQLLAVREYLGVGTPEGRRYLLTDVKKLLLDRQAAGGPVEPPEVQLPSSQVDRNRNALLPLMLLNALKRRTTGERKRAQERVDLVVEANERARR